MSLSQFFSQATSAHHFLLDVGLQNFPRSDPRKCIQKVVAFVAAARVSRDAAPTRWLRGWRMRVELEAGAAREREYTAGYGILALICQKCDLV